MLGNAPPVFMGPRGDIVLNGPCNAIPIVEPAWRYGPVRLPPFGPPVLHAVPVPHRPMMLQVPPGSPMPGFGLPPVGDAWGPIIHDSFRDPIL